MRWKRIKKSLHIDKENIVAYPYGERLLSKEVIEKLNEQAQNYMK